MYKKTGNTTSLDVLEFQGLSTDVKPTLIENNTGSTFWCVDSHEFYIWHIDQWYKF